MWGHYRCGSENEDLIYKKKVYIGVSTLNGAIFFSQIESAKQWNGRLANHELLKKDNLKGK